MHKEWPQLVRRLSEELGYAVRGDKRTLGYDLFSIDLSSWKLRLSNRTPIIWVKCADLEDSSPQHLLESLGDVIRQRGLTRQIVAVQPTSVNLDELDGLTLDEVVVIPRGQVVHVLRVGVGLEVRPRPVR